MLICVAVHFLDISTLNAARTHILNDLSHEVVFKKFLTQHTPCSN